MSVIDQAENAEAFISDRTHEQHLDQLLWMLRTRRDEAASRVLEWEQLRDLASQIKEHTLSNLREPGQGQRRYCPLGPGRA
jgi:L-lactate dehydrogenase complex protein LldF